MVIIGVAKEVCDHVDVGKVNGTVHVWMIWLHTIVMISVVMLSIATFLP